MKNEFEGIDLKELRKVIVKKYLTNTSLQSSCFFRRDYSALWNSTCLDCRFCYNRVTPAHLLENKAFKFEKSMYSEKIHSPTLFKTPITMSKLVDPLLDFYPFNYKPHLHVINANRKYLNELLVNQCGQVIFKTSQICFPDDYIKLFQEYKDDVLIQLRVFINDTLVGKEISNRLTPKFPYLTIMLEKTKELLALGLNVSVIIDPYIIGVNHFDVPDIIKRFYDIGVRKFTIKQLFSTKYFKVYLRNYIDEKFISILSEEYHNKFWTYNTLIYLDSLLPMLELIKEYKDIQIGICCNKVANDLVSNHSNCCLFDNPIGYYGINHNVSNRKNNIIEIVNRFEHRENNVKSKE